MTNHVVSDVNLISVSQTTGKSRVARETLIQM